MTLTERRDFFAAAAMQGFVANPSNGIIIDVTDLQAEEIADNAVRIADALIYELNKASDPSAHCICGDLKKLGAHVRSCPMWDARIDTPMK